MTLDFIAGICGFIAIGVGITLGLILKLTIWSKKQENKDEKQNR